jgi:hypothetical protein
LIFARNSSTGAPNSDKSILFSQGAFPKLQLGGSRLKFIGKSGLYGKAAFSSAFLKACRALGNASKITFPANRGLREILLLEYEKSGDL